MYTFDTNVILYYLKGEDDVAAHIEDIYRRGVPVYVSAITEAELFGFSSLTEKEAERIDMFLKTVSIVPMDSHIARISGTLRRTYGIKIPDSVIAATALFTGSTILTRNVKDFKKVDHLNVQDI